MSGSAPPRLRLAGVALDTGGHRIVEGLDLTVAAGEIVALVSPSGRGKTTLLRTVVRLADPVAGTIELDGEPVATMPATVLRRRVALVTQHPVLLGPTVADDLAAGEGPERAGGTWAELLREVGLPAEFASREPEGLSGGEQARVTVARALAGTPDVLLLDEPSAALDEDATVALAEALRHRAAGGLAILLVTHDPVLLRESGARVVDLPFLVPPPGAEPADE